MKRPIRARRVAEVSMRRRDGSYVVAKSAASGRTGDNEATTRRGHARHFEEGAGTQLIGRAIC